jgi:rod shape-determining protein MreC
MFITVSYRLRPDLVQNAFGFVLTPVQDAMTSAGQWTSSKIDSIFSLGSAIEENIELKARLDEQVRELNRLRIIEDQYDKLSALVDMKTRYGDYNTVGASVIGEDPGNWTGSFLINKGSREGIKPDMAVLGSNGLIGRVFETGYTYSKVITLIDDISAISVKGAVCGDTGILKGDSYLRMEGLCRVEFIARDSQIAADEDIITSHLSSVYPPGIAVGTVTEVTLDGNGAKTALVRPYEEFDNLELVLIITDEYEPAFLDEEPVVSAEPSTESSTEPLTDPELD